MNKTAPITSPKDLVACTNSHSSALALIGTGTVCTNGLRRVALISSKHALNANLRSELNSAPWSGFMSYFLGVICMVALAALLRDPVPSAATISRVPVWAWSGGIFGAIFIGLSIITIPKLGGAAYIALLVTGQMIAALTVDHFGWLGVQERPIDLPLAWRRVASPPFPKFESYQNRHWIALTTSTIRIGQIARFIGGAGTLYNGSRLTTTWSNDVT
jgi:bacterial/archaeal transporter family-2 protein